jgi:hypothetical protein
MADSKDKGGFLPEVATRRDTYAHMEKLMDDLILRLSHPHTVVNQDGTEEQNGSDNRTDS